jgi:hypothetical protein
MSVEEEMKKLEVYINYLPAGAYSGRSPPATSLLKPHIMTARKNTHTMNMKSDEPLDTSIAPARSAEDRDMSADDLRKKLARTALNHIKAMKNLSNPFSPTRKNKGSKPTSSLTNKTVNTSGALAGRKDADNSSPVIRQIKNRTNTTD